jgi:hypothetical protein
MNKFNFKNYLEKHGWEQNANGIFLNTYNSKTIKLIGQSQYLMCALNHDTKIKHKHIVTCLVPKNEEEAEMLVRLTMLNIVELKN